jgi:hypothetical protein
MILAGALLLLLLLLLAFYMCCRSKDQGQAYKPMPMVDEDKTFKVKLTWRKPDGNQQIVYATKKPLGLKYHQELPLKIFKEGHAHGEELGIKVGWILEGIAEMEGETLIEDHVFKAEDTFKDLTQRLGHAVKRLPNVEYPMKLKLSFETPEGKHETRVATKKPLGLKYKHQLPIHIDEESHGHGEELGIQVGWTLVAIDEEPISTLGNFDAVSKYLHECVSKLPADPDRQRTPRAEVGLTWKTPDGNTTAVLATKKPLGLKYKHQLPLVIDEESHGHGEELGIQIGWTLVAINGVEVSSLGDMDAVSKYLHEVVAKLPSANAPSNAPSNAQ